MSNDEIERIKMEKARKIMQQLSMPKSILNFNNMAQFQEITRKYPDKIIVIDFWAEWCAPCKMFAPVFEKLQQDFSSKHIFAKVNVDINQEFAKQYGISGIPTTLFIKNGKLIHKIVGATNYNMIKVFLDRLSKI